MIAERNGNNLGITVKDIAQKAKVSTATVSNVLTQKKFVSEKLARRVCDAVSALGYRPNNYARSLKTNRSYMIGIQIPDITNPYFGKAVEVVQAEAIVKGYHVTLYTTGNAIETERRNIEGMLNSRVDGMVCVAPRLRVKDVLDAVQIPVVIVDRLPVATDRNAAFVYADNYSGAAAIAEHMLARGYTRFLHLSGPVALVSNASERLKGFVETLEKRGVRKTDCRVRNGEFTFECGYGMMRDVLRKYNPAKGVMAAFVGSDIMAWGAMEALHDRKMRIPRDMGIVGYDNIDFSRFLHPALTTVENPIGEMSYRAAHLLLDALEKGRNLAGMTVMAGAALIERNSC